MIYRVKKDFVISGFGFEKGQEVLAEDFYPKINGTHYTPDFIQEHQELFELLGNSG